MHISILPQIGVNERKQWQIYRWEPAGKIDFFLPCYAQDQFQLLRRDPGSLNFLFRVLIARYRNRILRQYYHHSPGGEECLRTRYQFAGLGLQRVSFPVEEEVWIELRLLSLAVRRSMSLILVQLVQYEYCRRWKFGLRKWEPNTAGRIGTPTLHSMTISYSERLRRFRMRAFFSGSQPAMLPMWYTPPG